MAASYPAAIKSFTSKTDKEDDYEAAHVNDMQNEINAIETELGTDVAGSAADLKTRLAVSVADSGAIRNGTGFPSTPIDGQMFYRTDEDTLYMYNGSSWEASPSFTAVAFCFALGGDYTVNSYGVTLDDLLLPSTATIKKLSWMVNGPTYRSAIASKFKKLSGISTITCYARAWRGMSGGTASIQVSIGGQTGSQTTTAATPTWLTSFTIDVSSLSNDTVYDLSIDLKNTSGVQTHLDSIIGFGS